MKQEETCEEIKKEIRLLYDIGVSVEELDFLINMKMSRKYNS